MFRRALGILALIFGIALAAPVGAQVPPASAERVPLRWKLYRDRTAVYDVAQRVRVKVKGTDEGGSTHDVRGAGTLRVEPAADLASARVTLEVQVSSWQRSAELGSPEPIGETLRETYAMTPGGSLSAEASGPSNTQAILDLLLALPPGGLAVGGSWERRISVPTNDLGALAGTQKITLESVDTKAGGRIAHLRSTFDLTARAMPGGAKQGEARLRGTTTARFDAAAGRFLALSSEYTMPMEISMADGGDGGGTVRMRMDQSGTIDLSLK